MTKSSALAPYGHSYTYSPAHSIVSNPMASRLPHYGQAITAAQALVLDADTGTPPVVYLLVG